MAIQTRRNVTAMQLDKAEGSFFPLIPHVTPIWPPDKRIEKMKPRRSTYWRLVRNKMIVLRFLQSINPTITDLFSKVLDEEESGSNIVTLTKNFREEQRKKYERVYEIQMEAYLREEKKKSIWEKVRDCECATHEWRTTRESLATRKRNSTNVTDRTRATAKIDLLGEHDIQTANSNENDTSSKTQQKKYKAQTFRSLKEDFGLPVKTDEIYLPQIYGRRKGAKRPMNDPRFQRLLDALIPPQDKKEEDFGTSTDKSRNKTTAEMETVSRGRLNGRSLHEKWKETTAPMNTRKNSMPNSKQTKFTRPIGGLGHSI